MIRLTRPACPNSVALATDYKHPENELALRASAYDKCMYCESKISHIDYAHVEHIKPKAQDKHPQLEFDWGNLGYCCPVCNNKKGGKYDDATPYVDPYSEDPADHLVPSGNWLFARMGSERGEITIRDIQLNRAELLERRLHRLEEIQAAVAACFRTHSASLRAMLLDELKKEGLPDKEYSAFVSAFIEQHLQG